MKVADIMSRSVKTATTKTPFRDLWKLIFQLHIHAIPVSDTKNSIIGIIAEEDLLKPLYPNHVEFIEDFVSVSNFEDMEQKMNDFAGFTAKDIMNKRVIFTRPDTPILRALSRMIVRDVRQLPVITETGICVGMISKGDVFDSLFRKYLQKKVSSHHLKQSDKKSKSIKVRTPAKK